VNRVFPIEQLAKHAVHRFQLGFATEAAGLLTSFRSLKAQPSRNGLLMLADHEERLEQATEVLRDYYGADLRTHEPRVRHIGTNEIQEPIMKLSVRAPLEHMAAVQRDLKIRDADILVVDTGPFHCEIEARAPLAALLGYGKTLSSLTGGAGRQRMILSHYAPVPPDRGGFAA
jgi:translation elongation factor EF-G